MRLVKIGKKAIMLQLVIDGKDTWVNTSNAVKEYVLKNYKEGDDIEVTFGDNSSDGLKYVTRVGNSGSKPEPKQSSPSDKGKCADCGADIDQKYKKCYKCNQKNPAPKTENSKSSSSPKTYATPKDELIKREAVAHAASRVMIGLQGRYDRNEVGDIFTAVYEVILKLVEGR